MEALGLITDLPGSSPLRIDAAEWEFRRPNAVGHSNRCSTGKGLEFHLASKRSWQKHKDTR